MKFLLLLVFTPFVFSSQTQGSRHLDFKVLKQFRKYVVDSHLKDLPESLRALDGRVMTLGGFTFFRYSGDEIRETLLVETAYVRGGTGAPPGVFNSVRIHFKKDAKPPELASEKYMTVTGMFRIRHEVQDGKPVGLFQMVEAVKGDVAPELAGAGTGEVAGTRKLTYTVLEETRQSAAGGDIKGIPPAVKAFDGQWITLTGNLLIPYAAENVTSFELAKNPWDGCCLGIPPSPFDTVRVQLRAGSQLENRFVPILTVSGRFRIKLEQSAGYIKGLYSVEDAVVGAVPDPQAPSVTVSTGFSWMAVFVPALIVLFFGLWFMKRKPQSVMMVWIIMGLLPAARAQQKEEAITVGDIMIANNPKDPFLQGQALEKIERAGAKASPAIAEFVKKRGRNALTLQMTQLLEVIRDPAIVTLLGEAVQDKNFFWRPAAMGALAAQAESGHGEIFQKGLTDPLWGVRQASVKGLENLKITAAAAEIKKLLADEIYDVRAQAAKTLYAFGDKSGLPVLVEALRDPTMWFDIDYGQIAREDAWNFLKKLTGNDFGFKPWESSDQRQKGLKKWEEWIAGPFPNWQEMVPPTARARADESKYIFGFELRSCQKGDFFFRVDTDSNLVLGCFNMTRAKLAPEEIKKVRELLEEIRKVDPEGQYGRPGCDFEKYYVRAEEGHYDTWGFYIAGRPGKLEEFIRYCHSLIKKYHGDGPAAEFSDRTPLFRSPI